MALENKYGKSAVDATRRNALPPYLDELFAGGIGGAGVETHDITLTTSGWSNLQQSVVLTCGATDSSDVVCAANNTSMDSDYYMSAFGVSLSSVTVVEGEEEGQNTVTFTFTAVTVPTVNIDVVVVIVNADSSGGVPVATTSRVGVVKPDGTTISVDSNGTIHSIGSVGTVSGVKGNAESTYRTGNVNITPANIGISKAVQVSDSPISLTQTGSEMQALLNNIPMGKFRVGTMSELDAIPSANADWLLAYYDPNWTNRPTDYGFCYRMSIMDNGIPWSMELAVAVGAEAREINIRTVNDQTTWTSWSSLQPALTYTTYINMLDTIPAQPTSATTASFTVPNNGWVYMYATRGSTSGYTLLLNINGVPCYNFPAYDAYAVAAIIIPVTRGQVLKFTTDSANTTWTIRQLHFSR